MSKMLKRSLSVFNAALSKNTVFSLKENPRIKSWQVHSYGDLSELQLGTPRIPVIKHPDEVLVKVSAASLNPIDLLMLGGYGRTLFKIQRNFELELPLTLGRDFSGIVVAKGHRVGGKVNIGDEVYGFIPIHKQGSLAEIILADKDHILPKPKHLDYAQSASLVYATMTAWSALFVFGNLLTKQTKGLRVLVLGASGGVGTAAVQLVSSQNCTVYATCSTDAVPLVQGLGAHKVFDYKDPDFEKHVEMEGRYHIVLDGAKVGYQNIPKSWRFDSYITLNSPLLLNTDKYGLMGGLAYSLSNLLDANFGQANNGSSVKWGFFLPSRTGFEFIDKLIRKEKIQPVIHKAFGFEDLPAAFKALAQGHLRGKIVVDYNK
ncbi:hypothetical protein NQ318_020091 [Aromia moschata]|uniref:Enoyl reductase (ER) domain-containing protein n=1 Tax=Aromia moschata TaxID=1265417 RepID=A0AAV8ZBU8_9CUCU|nr:hypothetical protein NQ318_020091 [Aromia moschata]